MDDTTIIPTWKYEYHYALRLALNAHRQGKRPVLVRIATQDYPSQDLLQLISHYQWPFIAVGSRVAKHADDPEHTEGYRHWMNGVTKALEQYHEGWDCNSSHSP